MYVLPASSRLPRQGCGMAADGPSAPGESPAAGSDIRKKCCVIFNIFFIYFPFVMHDEKA
jgi:hypothetical protein